MKLTLPKLLVSRVSEHVALAKPNIADFQRDVTFLKNKYSLPELHGIDYDYYALPFLFYYYFANYLKVALACQCILPAALTRQKQIKILDLGCGSGPGTVALVTSLRDHADIIQVDAIDKSSSQLSAFEKVSVAYLKDTIQGRVSITCHLADIREYLSTSPRKYNFILDSYALCEMSLSERSLALKQIPSMLDPSFGLLLVVENKDAQVTNLCESLIGWEKALTVSSLGHTIKDCSAVSNLFPGLKPKQEFTLHAGGFFNCSSHSYITVAEAHEIVTKYKMAWEQHNLDLIDEIFTCDATYSEKPWVPPLQGIDEIKAYWRSTSIQQRDVIFTPLSEWLLGNELAVEWRCEFERIDLACRMELVGFFLAHIEDCKISNFREYFSKRTLGK